MPRNDQISLVAVPAAASASKNARGKKKMEATVSKVKESLLLNFALSGASVGTATACTNPIDIVKVRMQLRNRAQAGPAPGMVKTTIDIVKSEGPSALLRYVYIIKPRNVPRSCVFLGSMNANSPSSQTQRFGTCCVPFCSLWWCAFGPLQAHQDDVKDRRVQIRV